MSALVRLWRAGRISRAEYMRLTGPTAEAWHDSRATVLKFRELEALEELLP